MAEGIDATIEEGLRQPGAEEMTARYRNGPRKVTFAGAPICAPPSCAAIPSRIPGQPRVSLSLCQCGPVPQAEMLERIGPSLVVTAITKDPAFTEALLDSPLIERLNLGPISTMKISWDQPHEGNMFEFLYRRRSIERAW
jgi:hypothetical protein